MQSLIHPKPEKAIFLVELPHIGHYREYSFPQKVLAKTFGKVCCIFHEKLTQFTIVIFDSLCSDLTENAYLDLNLGKDLCISIKYPYQPQKVNIKFQGAGGGGFKSTIF